MDSLIDLDEEEAASVLSQIETLIASKERVRIFQCIYTNKPLRNKEIAEKVGCERSTVTNAKNAFAEEGLIQIVDGDYEKMTLSAHGESIAKSFLELVQKTRAATKLNPFLTNVSHIGEAGFEEIIEEVPDENFDENLTIREEGMEQLLYDYDRLIEESDEVFELVPFRLGKQEKFLKQFKEDELEGGFIIDSELASGLKRIEEELIQLKNLHNEGAKFFVAENLPDFNLSVFEKSISNESGNDDQEKSKDVVMFIAKTGRTVYFQNRNGEVVEWAKKVIERYKSNSNPFFESA